MNTRSIVRNILILIILAANLGCDQISKDIIRQRIDYDEKISVIDHFITLTKVENTGAFLSMGSNLPHNVSNIVMIILPLVVLCYAFYYLVTKKTLSGLLSLGLCLVIGGGTGNIIDRVIYGSVTDFLHFNFGLFQTGIVNFADISLTAGLVIVLYGFTLSQGRFKLHKT